MEHYDQLDFYDSEARPRTLYVGNLDPSVTEDFVAFLFGKIGQVDSCKIIHEPGNDPYCFVEFSEHSTAAAALLAMNRRKCLDREMKVNWATSPSSAPKQDTSKHFHVFVGDLCPDLEQHNLKKAFSAFGEVSDVKIICDVNTRKPKGYGFVSFVKKIDAERAIAEMHGAWLGGRNIRTNWATRKPPAPNQKEAVKKLSYDEVHKLSSATNCTVYCGQALPNLVEDTMRQLFGKYGQILEIRIFKDKGYAFVRFANKDDATQAIVDVNGTDVNGVQCKCSWGKESNEGMNQQPQQQNSVPSGGYNQSYGYSQYQNMGYNYPYQGYMQQGGYQPYYQGYQGMPVQQQYSGGMHMGGGQGGAQGQGFNGQQMQNMTGYQAQ